VPDSNVQLDLVAVMMPFAAELHPVYEAIRGACARNNLVCLRVEDIWEESAIIQDIFNLIFRAQVVVVDFTGKNPNVMYETGIAHTLGKHVISISQSLADVPFGMQHHRVLTYHPNREGVATLRTELQRKLSQFRVNTQAATTGLSRASIHFARAWCRKPPSATSPRPLRYAYRPSRWGIFFGSLLH
jgi:hypothetical protein